MKTLAIETSTSKASCALFDGAQLFAEHCDSELVQTTTFLPTIQKLLDNAKTTRAQLQAIAVDIGPGAFTSLRFGVATAQAFSLALNLPILGVSSLQTLAFSMMEKAKDAKILALLDARMQEIYCAVFSVQNKKLVEDVAPFLCAVHCLPHLDFSQKFVAVGNADKNYPDFVARLQEKGIPFFSSIPSAQNVARLAVLKEAQNFTAQTLIPFYVRNKVAQTCAERRGQGFKE